MRLSECPSKSNNFQLLRFVAAVLVIISHAFSLSTGSSNKEWLMMLTKGQITLGGMAVSVFFCMGGYLIAKSILRVQNGLSFFKARILKIFPSLIIVVIFTTFFFGPLITICDMKEYFFDSRVYKYLLNIILIPQHNLPGVFTNNISVSTVNGSLWTLSVEFLCYVACYLMWRLGLLEKEKCKWSIPIVALGTAGVCGVISCLKLEILLEAIRPSVLFYIGVLAFVYRNEIKLTKLRVVVNILLFVVFCTFNMANVGMLLCFPYLLFYVCFAMKQVSDKVGRLGNMSYGIYLCAFPIQQFVVAYNGGEMSPYLNIAISIPITIVGGYLLYKGIELPIIQWEKKESEICKSVT